jgi:hypothetical protein
MLIDRSTAAVRPRRRTRGRCTDAARVLTDDSSATGTIHRSLAIGEATARFAAEHPTT